MVAVEEEVVVAVARDLRREGRHWRRLPRSCSCFAWPPRALETAGRAISLTRELAAVEHTPSTPLEAAAVVAVVVEKEEAVAAVAVAAVAASVAVAAVVAVVLAVLVACA